MYIYNYRLFDRYDRQVVSLAVLADPHPGWRPKGFQYELWGCRVSLEYPVVKLLDYEEKWSVLEQNPNPFAIIVMAHLKTQVTQRDPEGRLQWKLALVKMLYKRGYSWKDILELLRFVDWLMVLPENLKQGFTQALRRYEEETKMRYVTSFEEIGRQQGLLQNSREAVIEVLETRFEVVPHSISEIINGMDDLSLLKILHKKAITTDSLEEFKQTVEKTIS